MGYISKATYPDRLVIFSLLGYDRSVQYIFLGRRQETLYELNLRRGLFRSLLVHLHLRCICPVQGLATPPLLRHPVALLGHLQSVGSDV